MCVIRLQSLSDLFSSWSFWSTSSSSLSLASCVKKSRGEFRHRTGRSAGVVPGAVRLGHFRSGRARLFCPGKRWYPRGQLRECDGGGDGPVRQPAALLLPGACSADPVRRLGTESAGQRGHQLSTARNRPAGSGGLECVATCNPGFRRSRRSTATSNSLGRPVTSCRTA